MKRIASASLLLSAVLALADEPVLPPGKAVVPTDKMRRPWGELVSIDLATRTGTFRSEGDDKIMPFTVMPHAELLHHAAFGDLTDYRVGERAIFRLHPDAKGEWTLLTYIQDELNFLNGHKEYYHVDRIDAEKGEIEFTQGSADKTYVREKGLLLKVDKDTRYWKDGRPAALSDIKVGDKLRTKTHGVGKGKVRVCWEVFLDDATILQWQAQQKAVHAKRIAELGMPGYVDSVESRTVRTTLFQAGREAAATMKKGDKVRIAPAGTDLKAAAGVEATVTEITRAGNLTKVALALSTDAPADLKPTGVCRLQR